MSGHWDVQQPTMPKGKTNHPQAYGDEMYWDSRYSNDSGSFDWYQRYRGLSPLVNKYVPKTNRVLMVGCGNAAISEDMVNDGYQDIVNVDISSVVIDAMQKKYLDVPQLSYIRLDVRNMNIFEDGMFDAVIDKGMFDSLMCGPSAPYSVAQMLEEIYRVLKPGGLYMLITYGDPRGRMSHLRGPNFNWCIGVHIIPRPGSKRFTGSSSSVANDPLVFSKDGTLDPQFALDDPDLHYVYICEKDRVIAG